LLLKQKVIWIGSLFFHEEFILLNKGGVLSASEQLAFSTFEQANCRTGLLNK
jgi:hypothetical protein